MRQQSSINADLCTPRSFTAKVRCRWRLWPLIQCVTILYGSNGTARAHHRGISSLHSRNALHCCATSRPVAGISSLAQCPAMPHAQSIRPLGRAEVVPRCSGLLARLCSLPGRLPRMPPSPGQMQAVYHTRGSRWQNPPHLPQGNERDLPHPPHEDGDRQDTPDKMR
jgi:hypothetical protein